MSSSHHATRTRRDVSPPKALPTVQSVQNALQLLETLAAADAPTLSDLARQTGFTTNQTFRLLATLEGADYVTREPGKRYRLGPKLHLLGQQAAWPFDLIAATAPHLDALAELSGETVLLSIPVGAERMIVDARESRRSLRVSYPIGSKIPLYVGGMGVAMLAFSPGGVLEQLLATPRQAFTNLTLVDEEALREELTRVQRERVRVSRDDYAQGEFSVASPILDAKERLRGALAVAGFTARLSVEAQAQYAQAVRTAAEASGRVL